MWKVCPKLDWTTIFFYETCIRDVCSSFSKKFTEKELRLDSFLKGSYDDAKNNIILCIWV